MSILVTNEGWAPANKRAVTKREPAGTNVKLTLECGHVRYAGKHSKLATLPRAVCNECTAEHNGR